MLGFLARWVRATFDYNPTFPISALLLLAGVQQLAHDGTIDAATATGALSGVSIVQAYELALLGVALLVLWPRRIAYETTAILIVFGVVRFAPPFLAIGLAAEGQPLEAALLGTGLALLMVLQNEAISRKILPGERWERCYDAALYAVASIGLPLLASGLARGTGRDFSFETARWIQLGAWWSAAALLAPLALRLPEVGERTPLFVPCPTAALRCWLARRTGLCLLGLPALLGNALWLGGAAPVPVFLFPLALVVVGVGRALARAGGAEERPWLAHFPAALAAVLLLAPLELVAGRAGFVSRPVMLALFLPLAAASLPLVAPGRARTGLKSLALVLSAAPLVLTPSFAAGERYLLELSVVLVVVGFVKRNERVLVHGAFAALALALHLSWDWEAAATTRLVLGSGGALAFLAALRVPRSVLATGAAVMLCVVPAILEAVHEVPAPETMLVALSASAGIAALGFRRAQGALLKGAVAHALLLPARRFAPLVDPGLALVVLSFVALGLGTRVALHRERGVREAAGAS